MPRPCWRRSAGRSRWRRSSASRPGGSARRCLPDMAARRKAATIDFDEVVDFTRCAHGEPTRRAADRRHRRRHGAARRPPHRARLDVAAAHSDRAGRRQLCRHPQPHPDARSRSLARRNLDIAARGGERERGQRGLASATPSRRSGSSPDPSTSSACPGLRTRPPIIRPSRELARCVLSASRRRSQWPQLLAAAMDFARRTVDRVAHGTRMVEPVVARPSRSRCACCASLSA